MPLLELNSESISLENAENISSEKRGLKMRKNNDTNFFTKFNHLQNLLVSLFIKSFARTTL